MFDHTKFKLLKFAVVFVALSLLSACQTTATEPGQVAKKRDCFSEAPLPEYSVAIPAESVPSNMSGFSGTWVGHWSDSQAGKDKALCHVLIVKNINAKGEAKIIYSTGVYRPWGINRGEYGRFSGIVTPGGTLSTTLKNGVKVSYQINTEGNLVGNYSYGNSLSTLSKTE
jgi:hypothetical protein